jgi:hypothetical protein
MQDQDIAAIGTSTTAQAVAAEPIAYVSAMGTKSNRIK